MQKSYLGAFVYCSSPTLPSITEEKPRPITRFSCPLRRKSYSSSVSVVLSVFHPKWRRSCSCFVFVRFTMVFSSVWTLPPSRCLDSSSLSSLTATPTWSPQETSSTREVSAKWLAREFLFLPTQLLRLDLVRYQYVKTLNIYLTFISTYTANCGIFHVWIKASLEWTALRTSSTRSSHADLTSRLPRTSYGLPSFRPPEADSQERCLTTTTRAEHADSRGTKLTNLSRRWSKLFRYCLFSHTVTNQNKERKTEPIANIWQPVGRWHEWTYAWRAKQSNRSRISCKEILRVTSVQICILYQICKLMCSEVKWHVISMRQRATTADHDSFTKWISYQSTWTLFRIAHLYYCTHTPWYRSKTVDVKHYNSALAHRAIFNLRIRFSLIT